MKRREQRMTKDNMLRYYREKFGERNGLWTKGEEAECGKQEVDKIATQQRPCG
jgi:hypothetical protein